MRQIFLENYQNRLAVSYDTRFYQFPRQYGILSYGKERTTFLIGPVSWQRVVNKMRTRLWSTIENGLGLNQPV